MGEYQVGIETKAAILDACRMLFYRDGMHDTSYNAIKEAADVGRSLIPYHFKSKYNIARIIYQEFLDEYQTWIYDALAGEEFGVAFCCSSLVLFRFICSNAEFRRFYNDIKTSPELEDFSLEVQSNLIDRLVDVYGIKMTPDELTTLTCMYGGVERALIVNVSSGRITQQADDVVLKDMTFVFGMFGFDSQRIRSMYDAGRVLADRYDIQMGPGFNTTFVKR